MRRWALVALTAAVLLAGCGLLGGPSPEGDLGVENGTSADASLSVTTDDGLNESELRAVKQRAMARIERLRGLEYEKSVPVSVITRAQYRANQSSPNRTHTLWNNQVWEALFLVGEDRDISAVFQQTRGTTVQGYYSASKDEIVIVSDAETPTVSRSTLVHELVHALQDQHFGLNESAETQDEQLAQSGVVEGEAVLLTSEYNSRCGEEWSCVRVPTASVGGGGYDRGVFRVLVQPYRNGPTFVQRVRQRSGWDGVDALHEDYPASSEQIIHPGAYPDETPLNVTVPDRSSDAWTRFDHDPVADTVGEASIYAMVVTNGVGGEGTGSYVHPVSAGWGGDALVPYRNGDRYGYVWKLRWDTAADAREFGDAYRALLDGKGGVEVRENVYLLSSGAYADAFRVVRDGRTVRIVNAPTVDALDGVHAPAS